MERPGLYFPFVHIRDENWLKVVALYWPWVGRLVPTGYVKHDSPTSLALADAEFLRDHEPWRLVPGVFHDLLEGIRRNADELVADFGSERAALDWDGRRSHDGSPGHREHPELGWIHCTKFPRGVVEHLFELGLARIGRWGELDRHGGRPEEWVGLHPAPAGAYMTALATQVSDTAYLQPMTDQADLRVATPTDDVQSALNLLLGNAGTEEKPAVETAVVQTYVMLALQYARPENLENVSVETILKCREKLAEELVAFRNHVAGQRRELVELAAVPFDDHRAELFAEHARQTIEAPLRQLEKGMKLFKLDTTRSLAMATGFAPPAALGAMVGAAPVIGSAVGTVAAVGNAWWQVRGIRAKAKAGSPVGYLVDVRDRLEPKKLANSAKKVLSGTYRPTRPSR